MLPIWITIAVIAVFAMHFAVQLAYQFGRLILPKPVVKVVDDYVDPWFHQNYYMFAPDPTTKINTFLYRVQTDTGWTSWQNPARQYQIMHWKNRLGTGSDMYDIFNGMADALYNGSEYLHFQDQVSNADWHALPGAQLTERYILKYSSHSNANIYAIQVAVHTSHRSIDKDEKLKVYELVNTYPTKQINR